VDSGESEGGAVMNDQLERLKAAAYAKEKS